MLNANKRKARHLPSDVIKYASLVFEALMGGVSKQGEES